MNDIVKQENATMVPVVVSETGQVLAAIVQVAKDRDIDIDRINALMDVKERLEVAEAKKLFAMDFTAMKPDLPMVARTKDNSQTKSKYSPLEEINKEIDPILAKYGFATATKILKQDETSVTVKAELWHKCGHVEETVITMPLDRAGIQGTVNKTGPHALSSSVTYAKRVAICALLNISTGDDRDGNDPAYDASIPLDKAAELDQAITDVKADKEKFLALFKVKDVREIKAKDYIKAYNLLEEKRRRAKK